MGLDGDADLRRARLAPQRRGGAAVLPGRMGRENEVHGNAPRKNMTPINRRQMLTILPLALYAGTRLRAAAPTLAVVKDPTCGCCEKWVAHLKANGFAATVTESSNMDAVKDAKGIPGPMRSCHTATIDGYVVEGHVPAADVQRLLKERPAIVGLAVPGMPVGSPGMESSSGRVQAYDVLAFDKAGRTKVFASYGR
jgi:hypothetical protein